MITLPLNKQIGISLSGGADSSLLLYLILNSTNCPITIFTVGYKTKYNRTIDISKKIIKKCIELTNNVNEITHIIDFYDNENRDSYLNNLMSYVDKNVVDYIITATTSFPPNEDLKKFQNKLADESIYRRRDFSIKKSLWSHNKKFYHPFINLHKKNIFQIYKKYDLLNNLFPLTFSCESFENIFTHCENCWWCEERFWAFNCFS